jgi:hypothetical protein
LLLKPYQTSPQENSCGLVLCCKQEECGLEKGFQFAENQGWRFLRCRLKFRAVIFSSKAIFEGV